MMRTGETEARSPKYAHVERERRFLVDPARCPEVDGLRAILIEDRYIIGTRLRLRRMTDAATGENTVKLTKKYPSHDPVARPIVTTYLDEAEYTHLAALPTRSLVKRRHPLGLSEGGIGIDVFAGSLAGLRTAEIEFADDAALQRFVPPTWTKADISADPRFDGATLAHIDAPAAAALLDQTGWRHAASMLLPSGSSTNAP